MALHETWHAPALILAELAAAISRGSKGVEDGFDAVSRFLELPWVRTYDVTIELARRAARIASTQHIRGCDAVYVALAADPGETLVTFDRQQSLRAKDVVQVFVPG